MFNTAMIFFNAIALLENIHSFDCHTQTEYCNGKPFDKSVEESITSMYSGWRGMASALLSVLSKEHAAVLRKEIKEVDALLNPNDELTPAMAILAQQALASMAS